MIAVLALLVQDIIGTIALLVFKMVRIGFIQWSLLLEEISLFMLHFSILRQKEILMKKYTKSMVFLSVV